MKYYTADTHFCHANVMRLDHRPWDDVDLMNRDMIDLWNDRVSDDDDVYILGDFCFGNAGNWRRILPLLNGRKHLIKGNHDLRAFPEDIAALLAEPPCPYKVVNDGEHFVMMSHYPQIAYMRDSKPNAVMLYGHVHNTIEFAGVKDAVRAMQARCHDAGFDYQGQMYNCWCGFFGWAPATLEEVLANEQAKALG